MNALCLRSASEVLTLLHERGLVASEVDLLTDHRMLLGKGDVFLAMPGRQFDPRDLVDGLLDAGACGLALVEFEAGRVYSSGHLVVSVVNLKSILADLASLYYETSRLALRVLAVTGTNGKTTVTRWLAQALNALGMKAGVIGTLGYGLPDALRVHSGLTTPDVVGMHRVLYHLQAEGFQWACVEASSIGLDQGRLTGVPIEAAVLTNFSQDHLDYHGSMGAYGAAKLLLAQWPGLRFGFVNADDPFAEVFQRVLVEQGKAFVRVGRAADAMFCVQQVRHVASGLVVAVKDSVATVELLASVQGEFNAENLVLVYGVLRTLGVELEQAVEVLRSVTPPAGRMERVVDRPCVVVDYAHTPDALERVLLALRPLAQAQQGRLMVVFGCGGDRDKTKRPVMGAIAARLADVVVLTSDNPRSESPIQILNDIRAGMPESMDVTMIEDREQAVCWVSGLAQPNDVVLLAGKGHEQTQTIGREVLPFSDVEVAKRFFGQEASHA